MNAAIYRPSDIEIQHLAQIMSLPGYKVLEQIFMGELDLLQIDFMNVEGSEDGYEKKLAAKHALAKGGAKFYALVCEKVAGYLASLNEKNQPEVLPDMTEEIFN